MLIDGILLAESIWVETSRGKRLKGTKSERGACYMDGRNEEAGGAKRLGGDAGRRE